MTRRSAIILASIGLVLLTSAPVAADDHRGDDPHHGARTSDAVSNLVSDGFVPAAVTDPSLVNGWGLVAGPTTGWQPGFGQ